MRAILYLREVIKGERVSHYLKILKQSEKLSVNELQKLQLNKLVDFLNYLKVHNPFYSKYFKDNNLSFDESGIESPYNILQHFPVTDKAFIKEHFKEWLTYNLDYSKVAKLYTSGSTGTPFEFYSTTMYNDIKIASKSRFLSWHGVRRGEKQFCYLGMQSHKSIISQAKIYINNKFVLNQRLIDSTKISPEKEVDSLSKRKPVTIYGYPSAIAEIAEYGIKKNLPFKNDNLKMVIFSGESHTPQMEDLIRRGFNCEPADEYCSMEGFIAGTCEFNKLHLNEDTLIAEILNENGEVTELGRGELLVTYLYSYDFPFIRYRTGDIVEVSEEKCRCERNFKVLKSVDGRKASYIYNGHEKIYIGRNFTPAQFINSIIGFQIIQSDLSCVTVKLMVIDRDQDFSAFEAYVRRLLDKLMVEFEYVDNLPREKSGKVRVVINSIKKEV